MRSNPPFLARLCKKEETNGMELQMRNGKKEVDNPKERKIIFIYKFYFACKCSFSEIYL